MSTTDHEKTTSDVDAFEKAAGEEQPGLIMDFLGFLSQSRKWWLLPILIVLLLVGVLVVLGSTALGPFIYPLF